MWKVDFVASFEVGFMRFLGETEENLKIQRAEIYT
jgi:hypothetical protein